MLLYLTVQTVYSFEVHRKKIKSLGSGYKLLEKYMVSNLGVVFLRRIKRRLALSVLERAALAES